MQQPQHQAWPPYFQPTATVSAAAPRIPSDLIDLFYLRHSHTGATELIAVVRCLGGMLDVATSAAFTTLPPALQAQIHAAQISQRHQFRHVVANEVDIFALDAVEQEVQASGFNDAVALHGRMYARILVRGAPAAVQPVAQPGQLTAGRLDVLHGYRLGAAAAFHHPQVAGEQVYHFVVPAAPLDMLRQGNGVVLVYPTLDPATFTSIDNTFVVLRVVYDLLLRLQHDLAHTQPDHPFASTVLPVPSRQRLQTELEADGYEIVGDEAIKREAGHDPHAQTTFLARLRRLAEGWTAPRLLLPPQATPDTYLAIIDEMLPAIATPADRAMFAELARHVTAQAAPQPAAPQAVPSHGQAYTGVTQPLHPSAAQPYTGMTQPLPPPTTPSRQAEWANDFAAPAAPRRSPVPVRPAPVAPPLVVQSPNMTTLADWTEDFVAQSSAGQPTRLMPPANDWHQDFEQPGSAPPAPPPASTNDWADDFR